MRVAVTGGAGFIGSHLIEALVREHDEVICIEQPSSDRVWLRDVPVVVTECGLDPACLTRAFQDVEVVYHLAGVTAACTTGEYEAVNTEGTASVLQAAASVASRPRVVFLSSLAAVGPSRPGAPITPFTVPHPVSAYGRSKLYAELVCHAWANRVPCTILRFPSVYGPRERGVLAMFRMVQRGLALTVGSWERSLSMLFVDDAVRGATAAARCPAAVGRTYCLAHPEPVTWSKFADAVGQALSRHPVRVSVPTGVARLLGVGAALTGRLNHHAPVLNTDKVREILQPEWVADPSLATRELGWEAEVPLEEGVRRTAAWYHRAGWL